MELAESLQHLTLSEFLKEYVVVGGGFDPPLASFKLSRYKKQLTSKAPKMQLIRPCPPSNDMCSTVILHVLTTYCTFTAKHCSGWKHSLPHLTFIFSQAAQ